MAKFNFIVITLLVSLSTFFNIESENFTTHNTCPQTVRESSDFNTKGVIVDSYIDFTLDVSQKEEKSTYFKLQGLIDAVFKEQQENYLVYQKSSKFIDINLTTKQIIFPFHWFT